MFSKFLGFFNRTAQYYIYGSEYRTFVIGLGGMSFGKGLFTVIERGDIGYWEDNVTRAFPEYRNKFRLFGYDWMGRCFALNSSKEDEEKIIVFDPAALSVSEVSLSFMDFVNRAIPLNTNECLMSDNFIRWYNENRTELEYMQCVAYKEPLFLGGKDEAENLTIDDMDRYWRSIGKTVTAMRKQQEEELEEKSADEAGADAKPAEDESESAAADDLEADDFAADSSAADDFAADNLAAEGLAAAEAGELMSGGFAGNDIVAENFADGEADNIMTDGITDNDSAAGNFEDSEAANLSGDGLEAALADNDFAADTFETEDFNTEEASYRNGTAEPTPDMQEETSQEHDAKDTENTDAETSETDDFVGSDFLSVYNEFHAETPDNTDMGNTENHADNTENTEPPEDGKANVFDDFEGFDDFDDLTETDDDYYARQADEAEEFFHQQQKRAGYIKKNVDKYLEKFRKMERKHSKVSWNWCGFLFSSLWLIYRKLYIAFILTTVLNFVGSYFVGFAIGYGVAMADMGLNALYAVSYISGILVSLIIMLIVGMFGNSWYRKKLDKLVAAGEAAATEEEAKKIYKKGGTNIVALIIWLLISGIAGGLMVAGMMVIGL